MKVIELLLILNNDDFVKLRHVESTIISYPSVNKPICNVQVTYEGLYDKDVVDALTEFAETLTDEGRESIAVQLLKYVNSRGTIMGKDTGSVSISMFHLLAGATSTP
jgi:hypothetical protein